jgi:thioredoxin reductase
VASVEVADDRIVGVRLADGAVISRDVVVVSPRLTTRAAFLAPLGLRPAEHPAGTYIPADPTGRTEVPGVWVAGNVTDLAAQVGASAAAGAVAGAHINADLVAEESSDAVAVLGKV